MEATNQIDELKQQLAALDAERSAVAKRLAELEARSAASPDPLAPPAPALVTGASASSAKISLFRSLFRGRHDVFARRWENSKIGKAGYAPACRNEWVRGVCGKPAVRCGECPHQAFIPLNDDVVRGHLHGRHSQWPGEFVIGLYPLLPDETCWFVAADFDKKDWKRDVAAFREAARTLDIPVAIERSRSGNGAHAWIFFSEPVPAVDARRLGSAVFTAAMEKCPDIGFDSYDRLFPSQDTLPSGGFGNLIALPFQSEPRERGASVFLDDAFMPVEDQWALLSGLQRLSRDEVDSHVFRASKDGRVLGVRLAAAEEDASPWNAPPSRRRELPPINGDLPVSVEVVLGDRVYIERSILPPVLIARLVRIAAFQNPDFYAAQAMRLPTFGKPRIISCADLLDRHVKLPRGCLDEVLELLRSVGIAVEFENVQQEGRQLDVSFHGQLTVEQDKAATAILSHDIGVLAAATGFGKTVVAARIIAARNRNTLVLVHRRQLLDQWVARLGTFLDIDPAAIGVVHGAKKQPTGVIDVALMQSLVKKGVVSDLVADYGHVIVDECHHVSAVGFEAIVGAIKARHVLGLSATPTRKDGHHPIIFMQCGPIRHRVDARAHAAALPFAHRVVFRNTRFRLGDGGPASRPPIQELYARLAADPVRNDMIFDDVLAALETGRSPVVITERKDHLSLLAGRLSKFAKNVIVLSGGMGVRQARAVAQRLAEVAETDERVIVATGRYLGEGFDDPRLDTLFLTLPISWRGTLAQYAGRLQRAYASKRDIIIYDYSDVDDPLLGKMAVKREAGYRSLGFDIVRTAFEGSGDQCLRETRPIGHGAVIDRP